MLTSARSFSHLFGSSNSLRPGSHREIFSAYIITMLTPGNFNIEVKKKTLSQVSCEQKNRGGKENLFCFLPSHFFQAFPGDKMNDFSL